MSPQSFSLRIALRLVHFIRGLGSGPASNGVVAGSFSYRQQLPMALSSGWKAATRMAAAQPFEAPCSVSNNNLTDRLGGIRKEERGMKSMSEDVQDASVD